MVRGNRTTPLTYLAGLAGLAVIGWLVDGYRYERRLLGGYGARPYTRRRAAPKGGPSTC